MELFHKIVMNDTNEPQKCKYKILIIYNYYQHKENAILPSRQHGIYEAGTPQ